MMNGMRAWLKYTAESIVRRCESKYGDKILLIVDVDQNAGNAGIKFWCKVKDIYT